MPSHRKQHGVHYTPPELARFLAAAVIRRAVFPAGPVRVLDPACGDGGLLLAMFSQLPPGVRKRVMLIGCETDPLALEAAQDRLAVVPASQRMLQLQDFLAAEAMEPVDAVIANPPYVRTQVLGAARAQALSQRYRLSGRVDLYQAFGMAIAAALRPGGVLGLLTSNRFLTIQSGEPLRRLLQSQFLLKEIVDLGDTRLFQAAVLPVIVLGTKRAERTHRSTDQTPPASRSPGPTCAFTRVYAARDAGPVAGPEADRPSILEAVSLPEMAGVVHTQSGPFCVERGQLLAESEGSIWTLATAASRRWLEKVRSHQDGVFGDKAQVRVGIKTTADDIFLHRWRQLPPDEQPEAELLRPLLTHDQAVRWRRANDPASNPSGESTVDGDRPATTPPQVLYPYLPDAFPRQPVDLRQFPRAEQYLLSHQERLRGRTYVQQAGREWFEIWVPQQPTAWALPKIVYPDISETPRFWLDRSGAVVNGDCYWITLRPEIDPVWLHLLLAIANSTLITQYYDTVFHNKLYAGRRRFMTQYVRQFPTPSLDAATAQEIDERVRQLLAGEATVEQEGNLEAELDRLVWQAFGLLREYDSPGTDACS
ncbi:Eco57I restriction-modification methylase domain-containing protein [Lignipirellula cremea]|nr:N-6 DNA methylase [Lignipirellula cremea]